MKPGSLTPSRLRLVLVGLMFVLVVLGGVLFTLGYQKIKDYSVSTRTTAAQAQASNSSVQNLINLKKQLEQNVEVRQRASMIVSESKTYIYEDKVVKDSYNYQDQIINDIGRFAGSAGITVTNITFSDVGTAGSVASTAPAAPSTPSHATTGAPAGVKTTTAAVTVKNPVDYNKMLTFIHSIEENLFTMRISQVALSKSADAKSPNDVTSDVFNIEVYLR